MATDTLPAPTRSDTATGGVDHYYCCDPNVSFCGLNMTGMPPWPEHEAVCPLCVAVQQAGVPCPTGCRP
ncbi:hypothetical protein AB0J14_04540 [Micromonospora arborensis]|uniref:hypothetical protein n=1 Tax=Micromonospora arborensis TaxID=2116518 RepID=UPI0033C432CD